ncbi:hypothetical protein Agabi119p4_11461 [Agaricus bisporus var. burnettii]|uniref:N-acetyltransferase domain-containing protein n=1 Tax=Agaricus bisporus var. burnettii TaxID=192524 RepID=A0A8H7BYX8_AGABI|nr:hypothetical protein Agabi119p4_11461 [Agaricus bisporus var. burnettii]
MAAPQIYYRQYSGEADLPRIMALVQSELSEPYVIYTFRYFLHQWPHLSFLAYAGDPANSDPIGVIVCKQSLHRNRSNRGYIAMLSVDKNWRKRGIDERGNPSTLEDGVEEIILETEFDNYAALSLYESLGFIREKRLYRFYLNGKDAFSDSPTRSSSYPRHPSYRAIKVIPYSDEEDDDDYVSTR